MRVSSKDLKEFKEDPPGINYDRMQVLYLEKKLTNFVKIIQAREGSMASLYVWKQLMKFYAKLVRQIQDIEEEILSEHTPTTKPFLFPKDNEKIIITKDKEIVFIDSLTEREWRRAYRENVKE